MKYKIRLVGATKEVEAEKCHVCTQGHLWLYNGDFTESGAVAVFNRSEWLASEKVKEEPSRQVYPDGYPDAEFRFTNWAMSHLKGCREALEQAEASLLKQRRTFKKLWDANDPRIRGL